MFNLPSGAAFVLGRLHAAGHQAYVVGGCVRDSLLGIVPKDWDVCTSALPEEMQRVFSDCHVIETGLKHGTLTVMFDHEPYEVTTFRIDGEYTDHRHPDEVIFVTDVREDLARRDFTVNAMAWSDESGLVDAFGGQEDLKKGVIRAVGDARTRFTEDALRILRAMRFASAYGFEIENDTAAAAHELKDTLRSVAAERIRVELAKLLCGQGAEKILREFADVLFVILPELELMVGFDQKTPYHAYTVWEHVLRTISNCPPQEVFRLTMLLHDSGKPAAFHLDEQGVGHMWGHEEISAHIAERAMEQLRVDNATRDRVLLLIRSHSIDLGTDAKLLKRRLNQFGEETLRQLFLVRRADNLSKGTMPDEEIEERYLARTAALDALLAENPCVTLKSLAVNGSDLMAAGLPKGRTIGAALTYLLEEVMEERVPNERDALLAAAIEFMKREAYT